MIGEDRDNREKRRREPVRSSDLLFWRVGRVRGPQADRRRRRARPDRPCRLLRLDHSALSRRKRPPRSQGRSRQWRTNVFRRGLRVLPCRARVRQMRRQGGQGSKDPRRRALPRQPLRHVLRAEYLAGCGARHRQVAAGRFRQCDEVRRRTRRNPPLSGVPLPVLSAHEARGPHRSQGLSRHPAGVGQCRSAARCAVSVQLPARPRSLEAPLCQRA